MDYKQQKRRLNREETENIFGGDGVTDMGSNASIDTNEMGCSYWTIERERERERKKERERYINVF